jgi:DNA-binding response OmpR family regulator
MAKILIIENDECTTAVLKDWLSLDRHLVEMVVDGSEGLAYLRNYRYDLVVLALKLPGMSELEVCKEYRSGGGKTPMLVVSGLTSVEDKARGLDAGADDYLTMPFHGIELNARVRALLRRPPEPVSVSVKQAGTLELVPACLTVKIGEWTARLRPREFALLDFLFRHPNQVFGPEVLLARVWRSDTEVSADNVRLTVKRLRDKLGEKSPINTIHGAGYILELPKH